MKSVWTTDYTQIIHHKYPKCGVNIKMSKFNAPKYIIKCAQYIGI